jgi:hypothetical protein
MGTAAPFVNELESKKSSEIALRLNSYKISDRGVEVLTGHPGWQTAAAILLLRNSTAKSAKRHEKGKRDTFKYRENTRI